MTTTFSNASAVQDAIRTRWGVIDWDKQFVWWRQPSKVRVLIYADSSIRFSGGPFLGLQYVYHLLKSRAYHYVDFKLDFAHRDGTDPSATIAGAQRLDSPTLDLMNKFDEVWFFGINSVPNLTPAEVALMDKFMAAPKQGGVLVTGDHADLGKGITGQLTRAGAMRQYPAPPAFAPVWNTTVEEGPDANTTFDFDDQSDDKPQTIRYSRYPVWSPVKYQLRTRPHPLLCGPDGPVNLLPDHQHEGEALAPTVAAGDPHWPTKAGHQEKPQIVARGRIKDPAANKHGQEIGVISAYDGHTVDVGRISADSTWHHWFDINLTGIANPPSPYAGFDATPAGQAALKKIDAYFLNTGVWLAPPVRQAEMRNAAWWSVIWSNSVVELSPKMPIAVLGGVAIDALGLRAPRCTVTQWILDWPIFKEKIPRWEWPQLADKLQLIDLPFEHYVAGGILQQLMTTVGPHAERAQFPDRAVADDQLEQAMRQGVDAGLAALAAQLKTETQFAARLGEAGFALQSGPEVAGR